jgi:hypothetical protein
MLRSKGISLWRDETLPRPPRRLLDRGGMMDVLEAYHFGRRKLTTAARMVTTRNTFTMKLRHFTITPTLSIRENRLSDPATSDA